MAMETKTSYYKYLISKVDIILPGEKPLQLQQANIIKLKIEKRFDDYYFPIMSLQLMLDYNLYYRIVKNKTNVKFNIKVEKYINDATIKSNKYRETVFDSTFVTYIEDNSYFMDQAAYQKAKDITGNTMTTGIVEFYLFKETDMISSRKVINKIISNANMTDTITYLLSKAGCNDVLMSPIENGSSYNEIILLPTTVIQNFIYLQNHYGLYKNGGLLFFDFDNIYVLKKSANVSAARTNEFTTAVITCFKTLDAKSMITGSYKDNKLKTYTIHVNRDNLTISTASMIESEITGASVDVVSGNSDNISTVSTKIQSRDTTTKKTITNLFNNKYMASMISNQKAENDNIITFNIVDFDEGIFKPNKKFTLSFDDESINKRYNGNYRLTNLIYIFEKAGEEYTINGTITIKKPL